MGQKLQKIKVIAGGFKQAKDANPQIYIMCQAPESEFDQKALIRRMLERDTTNNTVFFILDGYTFDGERADGLILPEEKKIIGPEGN